MKTKISYDFDDTLSNGMVQHHAKLMKTRGYELWIVTSRVPSNKAPTKNWNNDLYFVAKELGIPDERIIFTAYSSKHEFFWHGRDSEFLFHLDDDIDEINNINNLTEMNAYHFPYENTETQLEVLDKLKELS